MSILKRITKKYMSLRFLNKKATKLSILGASLIGLCLSSGYSFAKYRDENYAGGSAGTAKFSNGIVSYQEKTYSLANVSEANNNLGTYAFAANFSIDFSESEVALDYTLRIKFGESFNSPWTDTLFNYNNKASFKWGTSHKLYTLTENNGKFTSTQNYSSVLGTNISKNTSYIAKDNTWLSASSYSINNEIITLSGSVDGSQLNTLQNYKVIFFLDILLNNTTGKVDAPNVYLLFDLDVTQKGGGN